MDNAIQSAHIKENIRVIWPACLIQISLTALLFVNIALNLRYFPTWNLAEERISITINQVLMGLIFITLGSGYIYYKEHYHQLFVRPGKPDYGLISNFALMGVLVVIFGAVFISITIYEWFYLH